MAEQNFTDIGRLHVQMKFDEEELEALKNMGHEIAQKLRVIADCLDLEHDAKASGLDRDDENQFLSDHKSPVATKTVEDFEMPVPLDTYDIPSDADVKRVIDRTDELEKQIKANRKQIERTTRREHSRPE